jgi:hypothetical protein
MAITRKAMRNAKAKVMALVLNEIVCDLRNPLECRRQLARNGFTDEQIDKSLADAQHIARHMRSAEIDRLTRKQWG